jgi:hypothetical protein
MQKCLTLDVETRPNFAQIQQQLVAFLEKNSGDILYDLTLTSESYNSPLFLAEYGYLQLNK